MMEKEYQNIFILTNKNAIYMFKESFHLWNEFFQRMVDLGKLKKQIFNLYIKDEYLKNI